MKVCGLLNDVLRKTLNPGNVLLRSLMWSRSSHHRQTCRRFRRESLNPTKSTMISLLSRCRVQAQITQKAVSRILLHFYEIVRHFQTLLKAEKVLVHHCS